MGSIYDVTLSRLVGVLISTLLSCEQEADILFIVGLYPSEMTQGSTSKLEKFAGVPNHAEAFSDAHTMTPEASPAERTGSEEDFAGLILFMASRAGAYLNGETMITDGGRLAQLPASY